MSAYYKRQFYKKYLRNGCGRTFSSLRYVREWRRAKKREGKERIHNYFIKETPLAERFIMSIIRMWCRCAIYTSSAEKVRGYDRPLQRFAGAPFSFFRPRFETDSSSVVCLKVGSLSFS